MPLHVLFLCTGNSARSILSEATLRHLGGSRFIAYSAGSKPAGAVHLQTLRRLRASGISTDGLRSKSVDEFVGPNAPALDLVITLCDSAQFDPCPVFLGDFVRAHWSLPDPASVRGTDADIADAFARTHATIVSRISALIASPVETLDREALTRALDRIAAEHPAQATAVTV